MKSQLRNEGYAVALEGAPIYYRIVGAENPRCTIVLNDGIGCDGFVWKYLERQLGQEYRLVHWHLPGHGRSPVSRSRRVAMPDLADDMAAVLDAVRAKVTLKRGQIAYAEAQQAVATARKSSSGVLAGLDRTLRRLDAAVTDVMLSPMPLGTAILIAVVVAMFWLH